MSLCSSIDRSGLLLCLLLLTGVPPAFGASNFETLSGARNVELDVGGWVRDWATACPRNSDVARCEIYFLVRDSIDIGSSDQESEAGASFSELLEQTPMRLLKLARRADGSAGDLEIVLDGIEPQTRLSMLDVDMDGLPEPLLVSRGLAATIVMDSELGRARTVPLVELPGAPASGLLDSLTPFARVLAWPRVGEVAFFRLENGSARELSRHRLPVSASVGATTIRLETPRLRRVRSSVEDGFVDSEIFAVGPEEQGPLRWRVHLYRPTAGDADPEGEEIWLRTPGAERPVYSDFFQHDGQVLLLAHALRSDKIGIVERKKVRLYALRADRTRSGVAPRLEQMSVSRMWQDLETALVDHDSDGVEELTLLQREGFGGKKLQVDQYTRSGGRWSSRTRRSLIKIPWSEWRYGRDLTGDGVRDLLLQSSGLYLVAGRAGDKKAPFESQPSWFLPLPDAREPELSVSISVDSEGSSSESSDMSGSGVSDEEEALDLEDQNSRRDADDQPDDDESSGIRWGRPYFVSPENAPSVEILLLGNEKSRRRGGSHIVLLVEPFSS